jgi:predicted MFS family arabinose efflux permease
VFGAGRIGALLAVQAALTVLSASVMGVALARPIWRAGPPVPAGTVSVDIGSVDIGSVEPGSVDTAAVGPGSGGRLRAVLARPAIRSLVLVAGLGFGVFVAVTTWLQALLAPAGVSVDLAGIMLLAMVVAGIVAGVVLPDPVIRSGRAVPMLLGVVVLTVLACLVLALGPGPVTGMIAAIAYGLALLGALPVILSLVEADAREVGAGEAEATATGLVWLAGNLGGILVSLLVQALLGRPSLAFGLMALLMLAGLPVLLALRRRVPALAG